MGHSEERIFESVDGRRTSDGLGKGKKNDLSLWYTYTAVSSCTHYLYFYIIDFNNF